MNNRIITILWLLISGITAVQAQQGFGTNTPDASAVVDMTASDKGALLPRLALTATTSSAPVSSPATNLMVFNTATAGTTPNNVTPGIYIWNGTVWVRLLNKGDVSGTAWSINGNAGTTPTSNFLGTIDAQDLAFGTSATERMRITSSGNVGIGTATPTSSALLDVSSTTQGFTPPRLSAEQIAAIATPVEGLVVYNTTLQCLAYYANGKFTCGFGTVGGNFTNFYNGWVAGSYTGSTTTVTHSQGEAFSTNTNCTTKLISAGGCGTATTVTGSSGIVYPLVEINGQCWTAANMREIPSNYSFYTATSWLATSSGDMGYWGYYNTSNTTGSAGWGTTEPTNTNGHEGLLYQWSAAMNRTTAERSRGICPVGFHIPSDCELMYLEHGLGMKVSEQNTLGVAYRGQLSTESVGRKLTKDGGFNNVSGFSGLFSGYRINDGSFSYRSGGECWWSSSFYSPNYSLYRAIDVNSTLNGMYRYIYSGAISVRCLKD